MNTTWLGSHLAMPTSTLTASSPGRLPPTRPPSSRSGLASPSPRTRASCASSPTSHSPRGPPTRAIRATSASKPSPTSSSRTTALARARRTANRGPVDPRRRRLRLDRHGTHRQERHRPRRAVYPAGGGHIRKYRDHARQSTAMIPSYTVYTRTHIGQDRDPALLRYALRRERNNADVSEIIDDDKG